VAEKLTPQQQEAVSNRGGKLLVSAAAGSGKTKVLVDRLLSFITDPADPANVDDFLIITFTKAAAAELRAKIAQKLSERIAQEPGNHHLQKQIQRLYLAKISTVHSFCTDILRENAYRLDIPSDFRVLEERDSVQMQLEAIDVILEAAYEHIHEDQQIQDFLDTQGLGRNDKQIPPILLSVYRSASCHLNPNAWLKWCEEQADAEGISDAAQTVWGAYLVNDLHNVIDMHLEALQNCIQAADENGEMPGVVKLLADTAYQLEHLRSLNTWDAISSHPGIEYGRLSFPRKCSDIQLCEQIKMIRTTIKKDLTSLLRCFTDPSEQVLADLRASASSAKGLIKLVRMFTQEYGRQKKRRRVLDFSDIEQKTLDLLLGKNRSGITLSAKEIGLRFREIMVDEYQDSNGVQDAIFGALTQERQNCFMVGDVKQSIYQFRLADPTIFIEKYDRFVPAEQAAAGQGRKVMLSKNFRSGAGVIHAVNDVFSQCMSVEVGGLTYGEDEMLYEGVPHVALNEPEVELYAVDVDESTLDEEAAFTAERIEALLDGEHMIRDGDGLRPIRADDIVILLRSPRSCGGYFRYALECKGISCTMSGGYDLLQTEEVSTLVSLLQILVNPQQDIPLIAVMCSRIFGFQADDLAKIRARDNRNSVYDALKKEDSEKVKEFLCVIEQLRNDAQMYRITELIERIFDQCNYYSICFAMADGEERCMNLQTFCQVAADFAQGGQHDLSQFLEHLQALEDDGLVVESNTKNPGSVTIMTIHSSKGLEFPVVFLCALSRAFNKDSLRKPVLCHKELGLGLNYTDVKQRVRYPTIAKRAIAASMTAESVSEEMRVLYVAMTRARDRLIMTYAKQNLAANLAKTALQLDKTPRALLTSGAACPGDWIIQTALSRTEAGELFALAGNLEISKVSESPWSIHVVRAKAEDTVATETITAPDSIPEALIDRIAAGLNFRYPHDSSTEIPSKQTATQLKGRSKDQEVAEYTVSRRQTEFRKPSFAGKKQSNTARGNAVHRFMQFVRFSECADLDGIQRELLRLIDCGLLTQEQADMIECDKVHMFFASDLGRKLQQSSDNLLREFKFSVLVDANRYYPDVTGEQILLQGVVDCALVEPDGIVVVDFKTDYVTKDTIGEIRDRYEMQVQAYSEALEKIFERPILGSYLYLFRLGEFVKM